MFHRHPKAATLQIRVGNDCFPIVGWESCYTLGVAANWGGGGYSSVALMGGVLLTDCFRSVEEAHAFNRLLLDHPKIFVGCPTIDEMYERSGGEMQFFNIIKECVKKIQKRKAA